jgi:hypothetical protein
MINLGSSALLSSSPCRTRLATSARIVVRLVAYTIPFLLTLSRQPLSRRPPETRSGAVSERGTAEGGPSSAPLGLKRDRRRV